MGRSVLALVAFGLPSTSVGLGREQSVWLWRGWGLTVEGLRRRGCGAGEVGVGGRFRLGTVGLVVAGMGLDC
ncbi:hypothetical protein HMPREF0058_0648 [Actinomyces urogenitalis DSM 15434]|uniref:Uncharacterized protein n=1 Tax=Actinomyces urogenitalis DSM 15434 TaxID=525246 RepID=C0W454_9ACTO|nr:hypothetical protein HMPREF0058_0648 [Actinomyces urogenitalis DSM 15434]